MEILIILISVGALIVVIVICLCLCHCLCPVYFPVCCVRCLGALSRVLDSVLSYVSELCSKLCRCCHAEGKTGQIGVDQTQTELQEKERKEKCDDLPKHSIPVHYGSSGYLQDTSKGFMV